MTVITVSFEMAKQVEGLDEALSEFLAKSSDNVALMPSGMNGLILLVAKDEKHEMLTVIYLTDNEVSSLKQMLEETLSLKNLPSMSNRVN
ncbi:MAG: hypothetical protein V3T23_09815 [Nitrososphaerales archaeon]